MNKRNETFELYDLKVEVTHGEKPFVCSHVEGEHFEVIGENLVFPQKGQRISMYSLAGLLPILPAKQRITHSNDWMTTDADIACPDPHCGALFHITRTRKRTFKHSDVSVIPLEIQT
ncbi:TIGR04076 family protein [Candidatus Woesebacteria bacterium]|nr:TIGR04076 family protein [Candidatus Woesebacteria bacterium]